MEYPNDDGKGSSMMCRQNSTRWTPTTEQIRILKDLYYNNGVRSPNPDQIQKISAKLRQYGKIEGKNVFYWFQNHKARERQKKRLTTDLVPMQMPRSSLWKNTTDPPQESSFYPCNNKYPNNITSGAPSSSAGLVGNYGAYGSLGMEKGFRDCSLSAGFNGGNGHGSLAMEKSFRQDCSLSAGFNGGNGQMCSNFVNISPQPPYPFLDQFRRFGEDEQYYNYQQEAQKVQEIETLPLFPMHGDEDEFRRFNRQQQQYYPTSWYQYPINGCSRASLELTLNSYGAGWSNNS